MPFQPAAIYNFSLHIRSATARPICCAEAKLEHTTVDNSGLETPHRHLQPQTATAHTIPRACIAAPKHADRHAGAESWSFDLICVYSACTCVSKSPPRRQIVSGSKRAARDSHPDTPPSGPSSTSAPSTTAHSRNSPRVFDLVPSLLLPDSLRRMASHSHLRNCPSASNLFLFFNRTFYVLYSLHFRTVLHADSITMLACIVSLTCLQGTSCASFRFARTLGAL